MSIEAQRNKVLKILERKESRIASLLQKREHSAQEKIFINEEHQAIAAMKDLIDQYEKQSQGSMPPNAAELEEAILGALMLESNALPAVQKFLRADHFSHESYRLIYRAILQLSEDLEPVDMRTVVNQLRRSDDLLAVGGAYYIAELTSKVSSAANIEYHARVVMQFAIKRELINLAMNILHDAYDDTVDTFELLDAAENQLVKAVLAGGELAAKRWRQSKTETITINHG